MRSRNQVAEGAGMTNPVGAIIFCAAAIILIRTAMEIREIANTKKKELKRRRGIVCLV